MADNDFHHLIPNSFKDHPVFKALGDYKRSTLKLPNKKGMALSAERAVVEAQHANHIKEYNNAVRAYLDRFEEIHLDDGSLKPGARDSLIKDLQRLEAKLAGILTPSVTLYFDNLLPFITYKRDGYDLLVGNVFDGFFRAVTGQEGIFSVDNSDGTTSDVGGVMRIRDFAKDGGFVSTIWGFQTADPTLQAFTDEGPAGKFNMVFTPDQVRGGHPAMPCQ